MTQEKYYPYSAKFTEAFGDFFADAVANENVEAKQKNHEPTRKTMKVKTRARLTGAGVREIVSDQIEQLADFIELIFFDQRELLESQHSAHLDQLSMVVALVAQMQKPNPAKPANPVNVISEIVTDVVHKAWAEREDQIRGLHHEIHNNFNEQAAVLANILREVSDCKAVLVDYRSTRSSTHRRVKVSVRASRFSSATQGGKHG